MNKKEIFCTKGWEYADEESFDGTRKVESRNLVGWARNVQAAGAEEDNKNCDMICAQHRGH